MRKYIDLRFVWGLTVGEFISAFLADDPISFAVGGLFAALILTVVYLLVTE